jgi:Zn-dependent protease with chaperone function
MGTSHGLFQHQGVTRSVAACPHCTTSASTESPACRRLPSVRLADAYVCLLLLCSMLFVVRADESAKTWQPHSQLLSQVNPSQADASFVAVPEPSAKALSHYRSSMRLRGVLYLWNLLFPALLLFTGFSARMQAWAQRLGRRWYLTFALYCLAFGVLYYLASLPMSYYLGFVHPHHYDLSNKTLGKWLGDYAKGALVMLVIGLAVGWVPFLLIRKSPRRWWLYLGLLTVPFLCALLLIEPVWIAPLFHKFQPLQDKRLESKILGLAARGGIEGSRVYEVNMSVDTKAMNAYVGGLLGTKRIVFWDTMLKALDEDELLFILGHEMGHYVLGHIIRLIVVCSGLVLLFYYGAYLVAGRIIARFKTRFGFDAVSDFAALPLGVLLGLVFALVGLPVLMAFSRQNEHEADRFGLELTRDNHAAAMAFVKLQQENLGVPRPGIIYKLWLCSHPPLAERINFCNSYRPWESDQPSHYKEYIKP